MIRTGHVSTACQSCKQSRKKCTGTRPCAYCANRGVECVYKEDDDGRRKGSRKRKVEQLEEDSRLLHEILETIQNTSDDSVAQIVSLAKSNASLEEAKRCISEMLGEIRSNQREPSPDLEVLQERLDQHPRQRPRGPLDISRLIDQPPIEVPAFPWTTITEDSTLVSNLVSVWLIWDHSFLNWIDEDLFLRDMKSGIMGAPYCSPFLVNALLGVACLYSDYDEARAELGSPSPLMISFLEEAERLYRDMTNVEAASLTTLQGLLSLYLGISLIEGDDVSRHYLTDALSLGEKLDRRHARIEDRSFSDAIVVACWGTYNMAMAVSYVWQASPLMEPPSCPKPESRADRCAPSLYPLTGIDGPCHSRHLLHYHCDLSAIFQGYSELLFTSGDKGPSRQEKEAGLLRLQKALSDHRLSLPTYLSLSSESPHSVLIHESNRIQLKLNIATQLLQHSDTSTVTSLATQQRRDAALEIVRVVRIYSTRYGNKHVNAYFFQAVLVALLALAEETDSEGGEMPYATELLDLCIFFRAVGRRFPWVMVAFRMSQKVVQQRGKKLPAATEKLFEDFEKEDWGVRENKRFNSLYVAPSVADGQPGAREFLGDFVERWEKLDLNDQDDKIS